MRFLTGLVIAVALLWGGYWYVGSTGVERGLSAWFDARRAEGWVADYSDISTAGFPNRFDTTISNLELADPRTGLAWALPFFQILTLSYTPNHIIVAFPGQQVIASPSERLTVESDLMRGSMVFQPKTALEVERTSFELDGLNISSSLGWSVALETGRFATRQSESKPLAHDLYFEASSLAPSEMLLGQIDPKGRLPEVLEGVKTDMSVTFDAPWDRTALERRRPQPEEIAIKSFSAGWGEMTIQAAGTLTVDRQGWPTGKIDLRARNWKDMLRVAKDAGVIPAEIVPTLQNVLDILAGMTGNPETLDAPISFRSRTMFVGGLPVGPAPQLIIR